MNIISNIVSNNEALKFIENRILDNQYRGLYSSQHNRYTFEKIKNILILLSRYAPNDNLMTIRTTDISKRPKNLQQEKIYAEFCDKVKEKIGIGTQDAMRKNLFVDLHRMELIDRYDKNKNKTLPFIKKKIKYVALNSEGKKTIRRKNS